MGDLILIIFTAGGLLTLLLGVAYWKLHTKWGKTLTQIFYFFFTLVVFLWLGSPWIIRGIFAGILRNQQAWDEGVEMIKANDPDAFVTEDDVQEGKDIVQNLLNFGSGSGSSGSGSSGSGSSGSGSSGSGSSGSGSSGSGSSGSGSSGIDIPPTITVLREDAIEKWFSHLDTLPDDWQDGASKKLLAVDISCDAKGGEGLMTSKDDERYDLHCYSNNIDLVLTAYDTQANGFFLRDSRSWDMKPGESQTIKGMGDWSRCADCWEEVPNPDYVAAESNQSDSNSNSSSNSNDDSNSNSNQSDSDSDSNSNSNSNQSDSSAGDKSVVINDTSDSKGAWYYTPVDDATGTPTCVGIDQTHDGAISNNTTVTSVQLFVGAGWTKYLGSTDLLLVEMKDGKKVCVFAGTAK